MSLINQSLKGIIGLLVFNFYNNEFCIDLQNVTEVKKVDAVQIHFNKRNEAVINLDTSKYKLIQLYKLMGYVNLKTAKDNRVIFADIFNKKIAFFVESVTEVLTTRLLFIDDTLDMELLSDKKYLKGIIKYQGRKIYIPDYEKISRELVKLVQVRSITGVSREYPKGSNYLDQRDH
ncbi:MAG TPA: chemotaxis protein CheW [Ignavibacteriaceae bacterium]|nr:chemotaxis protein CheW [Ignavibacteriaceae bacterium]